MKLKVNVTPKDVFLGSELPPVRFSSMPSVVGVWIFSEITQYYFYDVSRTETNRFLLLS